MSDHPTTNSISEALKPCPFCGGAVELVEPAKDNWETWSVCCEGCAAPLRPMMAASESRDEVVTAWNTRASQPVDTRVDWPERAIHEHADEHGPSGGAWNISMVLERLARHRPITPPLDTGVEEMEKVASYLERQARQCNRQQPIVPVAGTELLKAAGYIRAASRIRDESTALLSLAKPAPVSGEAVEPAKRVMDALWPLLGGNHTDADLWQQIDDAVTAALTAMNPVAKSVGGEVEKLRALTERMIGFIEGLTIMSEASPEFLQEQADAYRASLAALTAMKEDDRG